MKTMILAVMMILSAVFSYAQDGYLLTKEGSSYIAKGPSHAKLMRRQPLEVPLFGQLKNPATLLRIH